MNVVTAGNNEKRKRSASIAAVKLARPEYSHDRSYRGRNFHFSKCVLSYGSLHNNSAALSIFSWHRYFLFVCHQHSIHFAKLAITCTVARKEGGGFRTLSIVGFPYEMTIYILRAPSSRNVWLRLWR